MKISTILFSMIAVFASVNTDAQNYYAVRSPDAMAPEYFYLINPNTATTVDSVAINISGASIDGFTGLALNPINLQLYAILKSSSTFRLVTIEPTSGNATIIGTLSDKFAGITFNTTGILYGITGDGASNPSTLYTINTTTGAATQVMSLNPESDGESIAFSSVDNLIYRFAGDGIFETINPANQNVVKLDTFPQVANWAHSLSFDPYTNSFIFAAGDEIWRYTPSTSTLTFLALDQIDYGFKGMVLQHLVTGIEDNQTNSLSISVLPNPAEKVIELSLDNVYENVAVKIYNVNGQIQKSFTSHGQKITIPIEELTSGSYFIVAETEGKKYSGRFIKQ